jgi:biopolymer transport protein ExbB/biopolymer transport protein TolQ
MQFGIIEMWNSMGWVAKGVVFILLFMSMWSIGVMIERWWTYRQARKSSRAYAPQVAKLLKDGKIKEAISTSNRKEMRYSHLAKVLLAGLQEYQFQQESGAVNREEMMEAAHRAIERATAVNLADMKRGLSGLATIGATAPFVGLLGTVVGIINSFQGMALTGSGGIGAVSAGIAEALVATAFGLFVAIPAVWAFNWFTSKVEGFTVEMDNSASELIDYMAKSTATAG